MPEMISAVAQDCVDQNGRLEMTIKVHFTDRPPKNYTFSACYEKHAIASYKTRANCHSSMDVNTLIDMSLNEFKAAFEHYGYLLAMKMTGEERNTFAPSAPCHRIVTKGIAFSSEFDELQDHIPCYPAYVSPTRTPKAIKISKSAFEHFKCISAFLFHQEGEIHRTKLAWTALQTLIYDTKNKPCQLFTALEIAALKEMFNHKPHTTMQKKLVELVRIFKPIQASL